jgi:hypothetical protein
MRPIAFITDGAEVRQILEHICVDAQAPRISPARGPPLWDDCDTPVDEGVDVPPDWDTATQTAPDYEIDQRTNWRTTNRRFRTALGWACVCGGRCNLKCALPLRFLVSDLPNLSLLDANVMIAQRVKVPYLSSFG